jgi:CRISPR-associated protein Cmx8
VARKAKPKPKPKTKPAASDTDALRLEYDLYSLPTAQHRAGLAGLVLQIKAMEPKKAPIIASVDPHSVTITFSKQSMIDLLDDLYDAAKVEAEFDKPRKDSEKRTIPPKRTIERDVEVKGKKKQVTKYIYDVIEPKCGLMARRVSKSHPLLSSCFALLKGSD